MTGCFRPAGIGLALLALTLAGCSTKPVTITGKLLKNGNPMVVSESTYVTLSFIPETPPPEGVKSYSARFDQKTGTYTVELPPGKYKTKLIVAETRKDGKLSMPGAPVDSKEVYDLTKSQELNIEVPGK